MSEENKDEQTPLVNDNTPFGSPHPRNIKKSQESLSNSVGSLTNDKLEKLLEDLKNIKKKVKYQEKSKIDEEDEVRSDEESEEDHSDNQDSEQEHSDNEDSDDEFIYDKKLEILYNVSLSQKMLCKAISRLLKINIE